MTVLQWLNALFPPFLQLVEALARGATAVEQRRAMIAIERAIADGKARQKFGR